MEGVYIDMSLLNGTAGLDIVRWGVGPAKHVLPSQFVYHNFYQWIVPVLLIQALIFYLPRVLWQIWEDGSMARLLKGTGERENFQNYEFRLTHQILSDSQNVNEQWKHKKAKIVHYIKDNYKTSHRMYFINYTICEIFGAVALVRKFSRGLKPSEAYTLNDFRFAT
jgi:Innexin